jgi:hypothetical protein
MSTIDGIRTATGISPDNVTSTTAVPVWTETRRSPTSDVDNGDPFDRITVKIASFRSTLIQLSTGDLSAISVLPSVVAPRGVR